MAVILQQGVPALTPGGRETAINAPTINAIPDTDTKVRIFFFFMTFSLIDGE
jgi:hypothetical protein